MRNERGFSLLELVVVVGIAGVLAAIAVPGMRIVLERNKVITSSELVGATIREARLAAITRNLTFHVQFNCPAPGAIRMLVYTGVGAIDGAANRCVLNQPLDGPAVYMPEGVTFGDPPIIRVNARGQISRWDGGTLPVDIGVSYGSYTRTLRLTAAGRIRTPTE